MKFVCVPCLTLLIFVLTGGREPLMAEDKIISRSEITGIKVYTNGATISRTAKVTIEAGQSMILFENLSNAIQPASIIVNATGDFTILSVTHQLDYLGPDRKTPEMILLEDSLEKLNRKREGILNLVAVLQEEQQLLQANKSIGGANTGVKLEELKNITNYFRARMTEIKNSILDHSINEKKIKKEIDKLNSQLALLTDKRNQPHSTILVNVSSPAKTASTFTLSYYTGNVSWVPAYDIRAKDVSSPIELVYKAMVTQNTGEDWKQVKMKISTGNPSLGATAPVLNPWVLNLYYRPVHQRSMAPGAVKSIELNAISGEPAQKDAVQISNYVVASETRFSTEYEISIPYSIPSNNLQYAVQMKEFSLPAEYSYLAIPKLDPDAFLVASISGWEELDLQQGTANIYYENSFIGQSHFNPATVNDTLQISLGRDRRILIKREKLKDVAGNQLIGQNRIRTFTYNTTIKNNRKETLTLILEDQLPIASDKDIEVKLLEASGGDVNMETGKISWKLSLKPGQQLEKKLGFSVKYPKDKQVSGL